MTPPTNPAPFQNGPPYRIGSTLLAECPQDNECTLVTGAAVVLVLLTAAAWRGRGRFPYALMGWLWFLGMLVPVIGIIQAGNQAFADRYTYLPLLGIMVALVWLGAESIRNDIVPVLLSVAVLAALAWRTREQLPTWKDTGASIGAEEPTVLLKLRARA